MRLGLSNRTVPVFFCSVPAGNMALSSAWLTTGPFTRKGLVGRVPSDGPGSMLFAGKLTVNESEKTPDDTTPVRNANGVF